MNVALFIVACGLYVREQLKHDGDGEESKRDGAKGIQHRAPKKNFFELVTAERTIDPLSTEITSGKGSKQ